jgi:hypothetical protein
MIRVAVVGKQNKGGKLWTIACWIRPYNYIFICISLCLTTWKLSGIFTWTLFSQEKRALSPKEFLVLPFIVFSLFPFFFPIPFYFSLSTRIESGKVLVHRVEITQFPKTPPNYDTGPGTCTNSPLSQRKTQPDGRKRSKHEWPSRWE